MRPLSRRRRIRFLVAGAGLLAVSAGLFGFAFRDGIQFFRTPSEVLARPPGRGETFRIGGMVEAGSLVREGARLSFRVGDGSATVAVVYSGITPDLFAEGAGVVATGRLIEGRFEAHEILAKHDEEYVPRELAGMTDR